MLHSDRLLYLADNHLCNGATSGPGITPSPPAPPTRPAPPAQQAVVELGNYGLAGKLEGLKRDKDVLIKELVITRKAEKKLQEKCENLEMRVDMLENSSKQMQNFILHYFSQVLQPYSEEIASRKRKRLPPAPRLNAVEHSGANGAETCPVAADAPPFAPSGVPNPSGASLEALRHMMQQMQMSQAAPAAPASVAETGARFVSAAQHSPSPKFAPATVQELPLDENGLISVETALRAASPPPSVTSQSPASSPPPGPTAPHGTPAIKVNGHVNEKLSISDLEDVLMRSVEEPSPRAAFFDFQEMDTMDRKEFSLPKDDQSPLLEPAALPGAAINAGTTYGNAKDEPRVENDEKAQAVEAIEEFMDLNDEMDLLPPLTELPEGTDIGALARQIQGFGDQNESP